MPRRISAREAWQLVQEGWTYVDVRSEEEFAALHPAGAVNIPLMHKRPMGMVVNQEFVSAFQRAFPPGSKVVIGCAGGKRSLKAAELLEQLDYDEVVEQRAGMGGVQDPSGKVVELGWADCDLPCDRGTPPDRCWEHFRNR